MHNLKYNKFCYNRAAFSKFSNKIQKINHKNMLNKYVIYSNIYTLAAHRQQNNNEKVAKDLNLFKVGIYMR